MTVSLDNILFLNFYAKLIREFRHHCRHCSNKLEWILNMMFVPAVPVLLQVAGTVVLFSVRHMVILELLYLSLLEKENVFNSISNRFYSYQSAVLYGDFGFSLSSQ